MVSVQFSGNRVYALDGCRMAWDTDPELDVGPGGLAGAVQQKGKGVPLGGQHRGQVGFYVGGGQGTAVLLEPNQHGGMGYRPGAGCAPALYGSPRRAGAFEAVRGSGGLRPAGGAVRRGGRWQIGYRGKSSGRNGCSSAERGPQDRTSLIRRRSPSPVSVCQHHGGHHCGGHGLQHFGHGQQHRTESNLFHSDRRRSPSPVSVCSRANSPSNCRKARAVSRGRSSKKAKASPWAGSTADR